MRCGRGGVRGGRGWLKSEKAGVRTPVSQKISNYMSQFII